MRKQLFIAVPAFLLGCLATASLTTTAKAQVGGSESSTQATRPPHFTYKIATSEAELNKWAVQGYAVASTSHTSTYVQYLMQRLNAGTMTGGR